MRLKATLAIALLAALPAVKAEPVPVAQAKQWCAEGYVGPRTTYGETKQEADNKRIVYAWFCQALVNGDAPGAFSRYVAKDYCNHSHMTTAGLRACGTYDEAVSRFSKMGSGMVKGGSIEFPQASTVDGDLVTQWGEGADIFRVVDGKITEHWDASPPVDIMMKAHDQAFSDRMQKQIDTGTVLPFQP